jgi:hypothetical protein
MKLYVNGDSHSMGHDAGGPNFSYGRYIADALGWDLVCDAVSACSNPSIIRRTVDHLERGENPDFIIIGWSSWERETWWAKNGRPYHVTSSGLDTLPEDLHERYKKWVIESNEDYFQQQKESLNHELIWAQHQRLVRLGIPHLFFNCYSHFFYTDVYKKPKYPWGDSYVDPYNQNMTYYYWLEQQGYKPSNPEYFHYGADAHKAWADFLLPKVQKLLTDKL